MRLNRNIFSIGLLIGALAWTLWFVFAGFGNHQDPLYWLYKYEHLEGGWMAIGTLLTGGAIVKIFGAQLLPLRLFGWFCTVTAIALPYGCLLNPPQRRENLHWLALTYFLMGYGTFQEFSPGTLTVLLLSALWVCAVRSQIANHKFEILTAIILGFAVAARFPNVLALLILIPLWKKRCLWNIPIAAVSAGIVYLLGYIFVTPAPMDAAMTASHEFIRMITKLWENGGQLVGFMLMAAGVVAIGHFQSSLRIKQSSKIVGLLVGLSLVYFVWFTTKPQQWYNIDITYLVSAFCIVIAIYAQINQQPSYILMGTAILMIATLGTDTGWLKLFPAVLCLLPVATTVYTKSERNYLWWVMALLGIVVAIRMSTNSVGQSDLHKATTFATVAPYKGIAIQPEEQNRLQQYIADYDSLSNLYQQTSIMSLGQEMHLMRAVIGCDAARYNEFWSNIFDSVYTAKYQPIIVEEHPIVFCSYTPQFKTQKTYHDGASKMEQMFAKEGYTPLNRSEHKYIIYIPDKP